MSLIKMKRLFEAESPMSRHIPITHLVAPDIFETQDGLLGAVLHLKGVPYLTTSEADLTRQKEGIHHLILQLGADFMVMETMHRRYESTRLTGKFKHAFCEQLHTKYHQGFAGGVYVNDLYLTILYKGARERIHKKGWVNRLIAHCRTTQRQCLCRRRKARQRLY